MAYSTAYDSALQDISSQLGIDPTWLQALIQNESGWSATAYNASSGATGLIQWIPRTMAGFGFIPSTMAAKIPSSGALSDSLKREVSAAFLTRYPDVLTQLQGPVLTYLQKYAPFPDNQSLYMAVFYPAYRSVDPDTAFPDSVASANPGIDTPADYIALVESKISGFAATTSGKVSIGVTLALLAAGAILLFRKK